MVQNGELFIYAAATLAPIVYFVSKERANTPFPSKFSFIFIVLPVLLLSTSIFTVQRLREDVLPLSSEVITISVCIYCVAVFSLYCAFVFNNNLLPPNAAKKMRRDETVFNNRLQKHREEA